MTPPEPKAGFNLSKWALDHPALTRYLMVVLMVLGFAAYFQLGQDEDPPFTFRAMVVRTYWPGATAQQVAEQVTDKIERTLQEVPYADKIRSYSKPGESQIIFQIKDSSRAHEVPNVWYQVRKKVGDMRFTLPAGIQGPFFNDEFGDVYGVIYALEADAGFSYAEVKTFADDVRQRLLRVRDVAKVELFGVQDEKLYIEISQKRLAQLGLDLNQVLAQLGQQNAVEPAGAVQTPLDVVQVGVIALMGMIQRNSVILIDQIEQDRSRGVPAWDAIVESAVRRLRPIVLTAAAAVLAMIPLSRSVFWGPMAVAIMGGLIVATLLTLLALPAMYAAWFRVRREPVPQ
jgi:multidrug efflux pump